jgi:chemotaxis-related protein WspB
MLFLIFELGADRYALDAAQLIEVLPMVNLKRLPQAPEGIAGVMDYHGASVPIVDLNELMSGRPAQRRLSTRTIIVHYTGDADTRHILGLIAERATSTLHLDATAFRASGVSNQIAPYLGPVVADATGLIQWISLPKLLPEALRRALFEP